MSAPLTLLHLDDHVVAIDKPVGLLVHPSGLAAGVRDAALGRLRDLLGERVYPVHRLDRATSGVVVFARSPDDARALAACFATGQVGKRYLALVRGWPDASGVIDHPLARDPERAAAGQPLLEARTSWTRLGRVEWPFAVDGRHPSTRYALVEARPTTGRRHQIRRHLRHAAHPLVGDTTHGKGAHNRAVAEWLGVSRLWLHAFEITVPHPRSGDPFTLRAPLGPEWRALLERGPWAWDDGGAALAATSPGAIPSMLAP